MDKFKLTNKWEDINAFITIAEFIKDMVGTFYLIDHIHMGLQMIMYGLSVLGGANHPNCEKAWTLLYSKKDIEGKYILSESFTEPYFNVGMVGQPNQWVTLYVLLSEKYRML